MDTNSLLNLSFIQADFCCWTPSGPSQRLGISYFCILEVYNLQVRNTRCLVQRGQESASDPR